MDKTVIAAFVESTAESAVIKVPRLILTSITFVGYCTQRIGAVSRLMSNNVIVSVSDVNYGQDAIVKVSADVDGSFTLNGKAIKDDSYIHRTVFSGWEIMILTKILFYMVFLQEINM